MITNPREVSRRPAIISAPKVMASKVTEESADPVMMVHEARLRT